MKYSVYGGTEYKTITAIGTAVLHGDRVNIIFSWNTLHLQDFCCRGCSFGRILLSIVLLNLVVQ